MRLCSWISIHSYDWISTSSSVSCIIIYYYLINSWSSLAENTKDKKTIQIFNHYIDTNESAVLTKDFEERMLPLIHSYLIGGLGDQTVFQVKKKLPLLQKLMTLTDKENVRPSPLAEKLAFLTTIIHVVRSVVDFGYLTREQIRRITEPLLKIFQVFVPDAEKAEKQKSYVSKHKLDWISALVGDCMKNPNLIYVLDDLFRETTLLFTLVLKITFSFQIYEFVRLFRV